MPNGLALCLLALAWTAPRLKAAPAPAAALSLEAAVEEALARSPELERARRELEEALLEEPLLLSATDPKLSAAFLYADDQAPRAAPTFQGSRARLETWEAGILQNTLLGTEARLSLRNERLTNPSLFRTLDPSADSRLGLEVRQPLLRYFWGRPDKARRRRARASVEAARLRLKQAAVEIAGTALRACLELHFAEGQLRLKQEGLADAERLVAKHEEKRAYGMVEASDLLQAQAAREIQRVEILLARSSREKARNALLAALYRLGEPAALAPLEVSTPMALPAPVWTEDLSGRGDLAAAGAEREAIEWTSRIERLDTLPDLALSGSYSFAGLGASYGGSWRDLGGLDHSVKSAGLSLLVPFGARRERLLRRLAQKRLETARAREAELVWRARRELRDAVESLRLSQERLEAGKKLWELERRKLSAEEENFRRGRSSTDLLVRFQQDIRRAQAELLRAQTDEGLSRLEVSRARGTLLGDMGVESGYVP